MSKQIILYSFVLFLVVIVGLYFFPKRQEYDIASLILELKLDKNIKTKDFSSILKLIQKPNSQQINAQEEINLKQKITLKLEAIINNRALINQKWYSNGDNISNGESDFTIKSIKEQIVTLASQENEVLVLEIFPKHKAFNLK